MADEMDSERKKELDELINRLDEEDNPVMVVVTLK